MKSDNKRFFVGQQFIPNGTTYYYYGYNILYICIEICVGNIDEFFRKLLYSLGIITKRRRHNNDCFLRRMFRLKF